MQPALTKFLDSTSSMRALLTGYKPEEQTLDTATRSMGPRRRANTRIIDYSRTGPFYTQIGVRVIAEQELPILRTHYVHRYLHATKGWREYHGGPLFHLPSSRADAGGRQIGKRSTWRPNRAERAAGNVPRLNTVVQQGLDQDYAAGKPVELARYRNKRGDWRLGFKLVATPYVSAAAI